MAAVQGRLDVEPQEVPAAVYSEERLQVRRCCGCKRALGHRGADDGPTGSKQGLILDFLTDA